jgi:hypothetical protein
MQSERGNQRHQKVLLRHVSITDDSVPDLALQTLLDAAEVVSSLVCGPRLAINEQAESRHRLADFSMRSNNREWSGGYRCITRLDHKPVTPNSFARRSRSADPHATPHPLLGSGFPLSV